VTRELYATTSRAFAIPALGPPSRPWMRPPTTSRAAEDAPPTTPVTSFDVIGVVSGGTIPGPARGLATAPPLPLRRGAADPGRGGSAVARTRRRRGGRAPGRLEHLALSRAAPRDVPRVRGRRRALRPRSARRRRARHVPSLAAGVPRARRRVAAAARGGGHRG